MMKINDNALILTPSLHISGSQSGRKASTVKKNLFFCALSLTAILLLLSGCVTACAAVPEEPETLPIYSGVTMTANGANVELYSVRANNTHRWTTQTQYLCDQIPVGMFDMAGATPVEITLPLDVTNVTVRPLSSGITAQRNGKKITFTINEPGQYSVEYNNNIKNTVLIFANPVETFSGDITLETGIYEQNFDVPAGHTLHLKQGAVIRGSVRLNSGSKIVGRGIIDGSHLDDWVLIGHKATLPIEMYNASNVEINGISIFDPNAWTIQILDSSNVTIRNLKIISSRCNSDGISIQSSNNVTIENSFLRTWDDGIVVKNYTAKDSHAITARNCLLWTDLAQSLEIGVETNKGKRANPKIYDVTFENLTVLHALHKAPISIHNGDNAEISDITFRNITVEDYQSGMGDGWNYLIDITNLTGGAMGGDPSWTNVTARGSIHGALVDTVKIISGKNPSARFDSREGGSIYDVTVKNLTRGSSPLDFSSKAGANCSITFE